MSSCFGTEHTAALPQTLQVPPGAWDRPQPWGKAQAALDALHCSQPTAHTLVPPTDYHKHHRAAEDIVTTLMKIQGVCIQGCCKAPAVRLPPQTCILYTPSPVWFTKAVLHVCCCAISTQNAITPQLACCYCFGSSLLIFLLLTAALASRKHSSHKIKKRAKTPRGAALFLGSHVS